MKSTNLESHSVTHKRTVFVYLTGVNVS